MSEESCVLTIVGKQVLPGGDTETTKTCAKGMHRVHGSGVHELRYRNEKDGTDNRVLLSSDRIEVYKTGAVRTEYLFERGQDYETFYETPYGALKLRIETEHVTLMTMNGCLRGQVRYRLIMDGDYPVLSTVMIKAESTAKAAETHTAGRETG